MSTTGIRDFGELAAGETASTHGRLASTTTASPLDTSVKLTAAGTDLDIAAIGLTLTFTRAGTVTETTWVTLLEASRDWAAAGLALVAEIIRTATERPRKRIIYCPVADESLLLITPRSGGTVNVSLAWLRLSEALVTAS